MQHVISFEIAGELNPRALTLLRFLSRQKAMLKFTKKPGVRAKKKSTAAGPLGSPKKENTTEGASCTNHNAKCGEVLEVRHRRIILDPP